MHEKLFHFLSIKISAKLNDEYRKMPLILSLSHIVDEQQQNRQYKKKVRKGFSRCEKIPQHQFIVYLFVQCTMAKTR